MKHGKHRKTRSSKRRRHRLARWILNTFFLVLCLGIAGTIFFMDNHWLDQVQGKVTAVSSSSTASTSSSVASSLPAVSTKDWNLILVNRDHATEVVPPKLAKVDEVELDSRIEEATKQFLQAIRQVEPEEAINSGYRSKEDQTTLYNESVAALEATGLSHEDAEKEVQKQVQKPGSSEHQTGLALDISVPTGQSDELAEQLAAIAPKYGFVLRYPKDKSDITGVDFENWHYRYVGPENAKYMYDHKLVLEEYIALLQKEGK